MFIYRIDVVEDRNAYLKHREHLEKREPVWCQAIDPKTGNTKFMHVDRLTDKSYAQKREDIGKMGGLRHPDFNRYSLMSCRYKHTTICKCHLEIWHVGQDESVYKTHAYPKMEWQVEGENKKHKKGEGSGVMISAFVDEKRGFGFNMTNEERIKVNEYRLAKGNPPLKISQRNPTGSPGLVFFNYGSARDGYWDNALFLEQVEEFLDAFDALHPDKQLLLEIDWSAGHGKQKEDGLAVQRMNINWGGKQPIMHSSKITSECLGTNNPLLKPGDVQTMFFSLDDAPPHFDQQAIAYDQIKLVRVKKPKKTKETTINSDEEEDDIPKLVMKRKIVRGWVGEPKGIKQILYERGLYENGMDGDTMRKTLTNCSDFKEEVGVIEEVLLNRGHVLIMSPKCHPEIAGCGIEYCWGISKLKFRRIFNDYLAKHHDANVLKTFDTADIMTIGRVRRFARKTRDYMHVYRLMQELKDLAIATRSDADSAIDSAVDTPEQQLKVLMDAALASESRAVSIDTFVGIEKQLKAHKTHRNIVDIESRTINNTQAD